VAVGTDTFEERPDGQDCERGHPGVHRKCFERGLASALEPKRRVRAEPVKPGALGGRGRQKVLDYAPMLFLAIASDSQGPGGDPQLRAGGATEPRRPRATSVSASIRSAR
jgi:hypothetical protein